MQFEGSAYRTIFEWLPLPIVLLDEQLRIMLANRATSGTFGLPPDQLVGLSILSLIPHQNLAGSLLDFSESQNRVLEIQLPARPNHAPTTVKITAVRLGSRAALPDGRATMTSRPRTRDLRLLLIENVTDKLMLEQQ